MSDYFLPMARRAYGDAALPADERAARTLAKWIIKERTTTINKSTLRRKTKLAGLRSKPEIDDAVEILEEAEWMRPAPARKGDTAGRSRSDYTVNPKVWNAL